MKDPRIWPELRALYRQFGKTIDDVFLDLVGQCELAWPRRWTERTYWRDVGCLFISLMTWTDEQKFQAIKQCEALLAKRRTA